MTGPRIIFHIGGAKCGSSAIQGYLRQNHATLRDHGTLVPGTKLDLDSDILGESIWFMERMMGQDDGPDVLRRRIARLATHARQTGAHTVVISAENMCNHARLAEILRAATAGLDALVVLYVRRQDDYFLSAWQQWNMKRYTSLAEYVDRRAGLDADWLGIATTWADAFGDACVRVRPFARDRLIGGDVVTDFLSVTGIDTEGSAPLTAPANLSFDDHLGEMAHRIRDVFDGPHDNEFFMVMARLLGKDVFRKASGSHLMTLAERQALMSHYDAANETLKQRFIPDLGAAPLFRPPSEDDVRPMTEVERLQAENALLMRCVYQLARKLEARQ
ncbi:MAG: hypothetical protein KDA50_07105 [Rhodobacteraceae bacterium]|nr:hypothetical protein [Paracoccaceae bacterium]